MNTIPGQGGYGSTLIPAIDGKGQMLQFGNSGGSQANTENAATLLHSVNAQLPILPDPLRLLHGPLLVTVETWSDKSIVARLPCVALEANGESDVEAIGELGVAVLDFATSMVRLLANGDSIGGPLKLDWDNLTALVDVSGLSQ